MVQRLGKTKVRIVPRDGEVEITLNINITLDGKLTAMSDDAAVTTLSDEDDVVPTFIPDFGSGKKLDFGKKE
jgi:hypothetical protein